MSFELISTIALLFGLEIVLGIDNVLVISILVGRLPEEIRQKARIMGLSAALILRLVALAIVLHFCKMQDPIIWKFSIRDLILLSGGLFLLWKASVEIYEAVELHDEGDAQVGAAGKTFAMIMTQIMLLDLVFSVDSVITAVALINNFWAIASAVILSFLVVLLYAGPVGKFIIQHASLKILALAFLITVGATLVLEGIGKPVEKAYLYLPLGFAFGVQLLQMRRTKNEVKQGKAIFCTRCRYLPNNTNES